MPASTAARYRGGTSAVTAPITVGAATTLSLLHVDGRPTFPNTTLRQLRWGYLVIRLSADIRGGGK